MNKKDQDRLINKTISWSNNIEVSNDGRLIIETDHHYFDLREQDIYESYSKYQKRTNGGGERAILRRSKRFLSKRQKQEMIGKSSRKYSRIKNQWLDEIDDN